MGQRDHTHEEAGYYLDQACMVTLSTAFGGICLALYFWKTDMLIRLLGRQFHVFVLISGGTLVGLAFLRALALWAQTRRKGHHHGDQAHHHHEKAVPCDSHGAGFHHDHGAKNHDHDWAPWRYVVLLLPVALFILGLPNKGPKSVAAAAEFIKSETQREATEALGLFSPSSLGWSQLTYVGFLCKDQVKGDVQDWDFRNLWPKVAADALSSDANDREQWKNKYIRVIGQYSPSLQSDRQFGLVRWKRTCCAGDAIPLNLPIISRESIRNIKRDAWVCVTGRVEFRRRFDELVPIIAVSSSHAVQSCPEDPNPHVEW